MAKEKSGEKTLLLSVIMSAPGPLILGLGLLSGRSTTQIADFVRRNSELLAIIVAYITYKITMKKPENKENIERFSNQFVGAMMCLGGTLMMLITLFSENTDKGNVIPALIIAIMGVIANTLFWLKYAKINCAEPNPIIAVQSRLYRAKSLVDWCITIALLSVVFMPASPVSYWLDFVGSIIVAAYLVWCGIKTLKEAKNNL
ncbi:MAG: cation transporter [Clostridia bacterium]|nr:cation transporter [Clostridia bacterium]